MKIGMIIGILALLSIASLAGYIYYNEFMGVALGDPCGFDYGKCKSGLSCLPPAESGTIYPENPVTGNSFGICGKGSNDRLIADVCGTDIIGCCEEDLQCGLIASENERLCLSEEDFKNFPDSYTKVDEKPCY